MHRSCAEDPVAAQRALIDQLLHTRAYPHAVEHIACIETHISIVLLTGSFAYKIKKPVNLGFLDFSTLALRRHFCEEELRLNRRFAPDLYLDVVGIRRDGDALQLCAKDAPDVIEYAVKMKQFDPHALFDHLLGNDALTPAHIDALARAVADFHLALPRPGADNPYGRTTTQEMQLRQNFNQIRALAAAGEVPSMMDDIERWSIAEHAALAALMDARRDGGSVRECHGDLHLGNIALIEGEVRLFDGIEFSADLRWCDVMNEIAFLVMDLAAHGCAGFGARFLNAYLDITGDYAGLRLLRGFLVYRAMVRAKVACIRAHQPGLSTDARAAADADFNAYLHLARGYTQPHPPWLIITHGVSGSGKTTITQPLLEAFGAIRLRSDLERKRLHGFAAAARTGSGIGAGIYGAAVSEDTYAELQRLATLLLQAGWPVIVDATFLRRHQRDAFRALSREMNVPHLVLDCRADVAELKRRVKRRSRQGGDASEATVAVLEHQLQTAEALTADERGDALEVDTARADLRDVIASIGRRVGAG